MATTCLRFFVAIAALLVADRANAQSAASPAARNIVLVHGALIDGSSWRGVYDVLTRDGYRVSIVQEPLTGFDEDVAATKRVLDRQDGPVILVGNSYGGQIITAAGTDPRSRHWSPLQPFSLTWAKPALLFTLPVPRQAQIKLDYCG